MKQLIISIILLASVSAFAQVGALTKADLTKEVQPIKSSIQVLQQENGKLRAKVSGLQNQLSNANRSIDSLKSQVETNNKMLSQTVNELGNKISLTETNSNQRITQVDNALSKKSLYAILGFLLAILLSGILYWLLSKRQQTDKTDFIDQLSKTKSAIEESLVKEFGKQTELMDAQLHLIQQQKISLQAMPNAEPDHSLALKVADQITNIERAISLMDEKTKGLQRIKNSVTNLKDNLAANGYEVIEMLGKQLNKGMNIIVANSIPDDNLKKDDEIITRIIKPQVNYNDIMIQAAQVEVSVGY